MATPRKAPAQPVVEPPPPVDNPIQEDAKQDVVVTQAEDTKLTVYDAIGEELSLPIEEIVKLVKTESLVTEQLAKLAVQYARAAGIPLAGLNLITNSKGGVTVFINSEGIRFKLHRDERKVKEWTHKIAHLPTKDDPYVEVTADLVFGDGSHYTNSSVEYFKFVIVNQEWQGRSKAGNWNPVSVGDRVMANITKAKRRAAADAVGAGLPWYDEDYYEWRRDQDTVETTAKVIPVRDWQKQPPTNFAELMTWAKEININTDQLPVLAGLDNMGALMTSAAQSFSDLWTTIQEKAYGRKD